MTFNEVKREAIDAVAKRNTGAKCIAFAEAPDGEYLGEFTFSIGEPGTFRFWRNPATGNLLFLEA